MMTKQEAKELKATILAQFPTLEIETIEFKDTDYGYLNFMHKGEWISISIWHLTDWERIQDWTLNFAFMSAGVL